MEEEAEGRYVDIILFSHIDLISHFYKIFSKIAIQGTPQMAVDKEAIICLSRVYSYYFKCNFPLF